ncbi:MAG: hypothetical protein RBS92_07485 [Candidatus Cloacimonadales bacterium]|jgi:hypothetical protein|nr:hypothetical protein [Candidatus Cloacimonadales bacterium]HQB41253.1 hypothetical protein [Candidatus Cloacimonadota bacterium]
MKVYLSGDHKFPKRIGESILAYYANNNVVILRKSVKRAILPQNINIKNNQPYLCALWQEMPLQVKTLFTDYAKFFKMDTKQKRTQGVSAFSMFIYFIYRAQKRFGTLIKDMSIDFVLSIFHTFNSLNKLMKESLLYRLTMKLPTRFRHLVKKKTVLEDEAEGSMSNYSIQKGSNELQDNDIRQSVTDPGFDGG